MGDMQGMPIGSWKGRALPENMESAAAFAGRAVQWWQEHVLGHVSESAKGAAGVRGGADGGEAKQVLVVSHGGLMYAMVQELIKSGQVEVGRGVDIGQCRFPNASVSVIEVNENKIGTLVKFADTAHLIEMELVKGNADIVDGKLAKE